MSRPPPRRAGYAPVALAGVGGLLVAGGTVADWVRREEVREVGGVALREVTGVAGTQLAGGLVGVGVAAVALGLVLLLVRGRARALAGVLLGLAGLAGVGVLAAGLAAAAALPGDLTAGPGVTGLGALAVLVGAVTAVRRPAAPPSLPARYALDDPPAEAAPGAGDRTEAERGASTAADTDPETRSAQEWDRASVEADGS